MRGGRSSGYCGDMRAWRTRVRAAVAVALVTMVAAGCGGGSSAPPTTINADQGARANTALAELSHAITAWHAATSLCHADAQFRTCVPRASQKVGLPTAISNYSALLKELQTKVGGDCRIKLEAARKAVDIYGQLVGRQNRDVASRGLGLLGIVSDEQKTLAQESQVGRSTGAAQAACVE
jgi:hypothetical protein